MVPFFEAFERIRVAERLKEVFCGVFVGKINVSRVKKQAFVRCNSGKFLPYSVIKEMEETLGKQIFQKEGFTPVLEISFPDMEKYSLEQLWNKIGDEILKEIKERDIVSYCEFCEQPFQISNETIIVHCDDSFLTRDRAVAFETYLTGLFHKRFEKEVSLSFEYGKKEKKRKEKPPIEEYFVVSRSEILSHNETAGRGEEVSVKAKIHKKQVTKLTNEQKNDWKTSNRKGAQYRQANDPDVFYGKNCEGTVVPIVDIQDEIGDVVIAGQVLNVESREIGSEKLLIMFPVTDFTDSITCKIFIRKDLAKETEIFEFIKKKNFLKIKGTAQFDSFSKQICIMSVTGIKEIQNFKKKHQDNSDEKRVELHAHTKMSDMDAVTDCATMVRQAYEWGHRAVAITDHGVVQGFTDAFHAVQGLRLDKEDPFKVIYGVEAYLIDDLVPVAERENGQSLDSPAVLLSILTTGPSMQREEIIEISARRIENGQMTEHFHTFVNRQYPLPFELASESGIKDEHLVSAPSIKECLKKLKEFCQGAYILAQDSIPTWRWLKEKGKSCGIDFSSETVVDMTKIEQFLMEPMKKFTLKNICKRMKIQLSNEYRAQAMSEAMEEVWKRLIRILNEKGIYHLKELNEATAGAPEIIKMQPYYHAIMLIQNETGRVNLYRLVSESHLKYFYRRPRIPKSLFIKYREGILLGSACEAGELARAITKDEGEERIDELCKFYDYLEIQPAGNNQFMLESKRYPYIKTYEDLLEINRTIVSLGEMYHKMVAATCDVHFLNPEDSIYRRIIQAGTGMDEEQPPLYFRSTEEMLEEFSYLGEDMAYEVVIKNPNRIADLVEKIEPVYPDKCPPVIPNSDEDLRRICETRAVQMYGEPLPPQVKERLDHELKSIISNGFAVMYIIAQKLVWKSNEDGYLVGSRGSVGSSFAATMAGITEVNPLPAHYYCEHCHYVDFDSEEVKAFSGSSGCDMPPKTCPNCGEPLIRDGHDIPFETFLGFYGDKEPDIDLNFSGEYQSKAHAYTEVIFGEGQTFRAGTIGTMADKTAFGFVKKFYDERGISKRNEEISRIVDGCVGVRRSTGQHPGGIIVLPFGWDIYTFTPVQHPANDMETSIITTHFDYHSIDHNLLKLDILGHDDPTMIRMLEDLTGMDATTISLDDEKVLSLFANTEALGVTPDELMGCDLGSLGIPEFGTEFVMQMLRDTKPKHFSDLVRISGLSHGTDVWLNNAQYYIKNGDCKLSTAICTRDDIMTYLIHTGVENGLAFKIMESVRKGKGLTDEWEEKMREAGVEEWYIESCKKIKYMFPKAHAVAYVMMAFRIAYFKVYEPLAYYTAYFGIRAKAFDYELMCLGKEKLENTMKEYKKRFNDLSKKEQDSYGDMRIVQEMYARGYEFEPIDLFQASAYDFQIVNDRLMPALCTIEGMGGKAAEAVVEAAKDGPFTSVENFKQRAKVSGTTAEKMKSLNLLGDIPMTDQMSLADFFVS